MPLNAPEVEGASAAKNCAHEIISELDVMKLSSIAPRELSTGTSYVYLQQARQQHDSVCIT